MLTYHHNLKKETMLFYDVSNTSDFLRVDAQTAAVVHQV